MAIKLFGMANGSRLRRSDTFFQYSTSEQFTGEYWIDGKKIYCKTIVKNNLKIYHNLAFAHGIGGINQVIYLTGIFHINSTGVTLPFPTAGGAGRPLQIQGEKNYIRFTGSDTWEASTDRDIIVTIYYTKV